MLTPVEIPGVFTDQRRTEKGNQPDSIRLNMSYYICRAREHSFECQWGQCILLTVGRILVECRKSSVF